MKIKIIKIEIGEAPAGMYGRFLERIIPKPLRIAFTEAEEINPLLEDTFTREVLPITRFAYGKHWEEYYMRDEDRKKFEELANVYVNMGKIELLKEIREFLNSKNSENIYSFIRALLEKEELKEEVRMKQSDYKDTEKLT